MTPAALVRVAALRFARPGRAAVVRANRRRAARAAVLGGLALLAVALLGTGLAVETVKPGWRDPEYGYRLKRVRQLRAEHPGRPLVVAVGSSRTQMAVSPGAMGLPDEPGAPLVFNFGQAGAGPLQTLLTVLRLLDDGVNPDAVLVEFFPAALVADGPAEVQFAQLVPRLSWGDVRRLGPYCDDPAALRRVWAAGRAATPYTNRLTLVSHALPGWLPWKNRVEFQWQMMDRFGFTPYPRDAVPAAERDSAYANQYKPALADLHIGRTSDRAIHDLVGRCRERGIRVAFYATPEGPRFHGWYSPATHATVAAFRVGLGVPVFDAAGDFSEDDFADGHHVLPGAAARFSRRLAADHLLPWLRGTPAG